MSYPYIQQQTTGEPLANPWYTPGWTSQDPDYQVVPENEFTIPGFPAGAVYVTVTANQFDTDGDPIAGYYTFWPSSSLTFTVDGVTTSMPQRRAGMNLWDVAGAYWGTGKMYLRNGNLLVNLLATDNAGVNMVPSAFTYHVKEHFLRGQEYDITVPSASESPVDIHDLIISEDSNVCNGPISQTFTDLAVWTMTYTYPFTPAVITLDTDGNQIFGAVSYDQGLISSTVTVTFGSPISGTMELH
jgi:hypothetical protein